MLLTIFSYVCTISPCIPGFLVVAVVAEAIGGHPAQVFFSGVPEMSAIEVSCEAGSILRLIAAIPVAFIRLFASTKKTRLYETLVINERRLTVFSYGSSFALLLVSRKGNRSLSTGISYEGKVSPTTM